MTARDGVAAHRGSAATSCWLTEDDEHERRVTGAARADRAAQVEPVHLRHQACPGSRRRRGCRRSIAVSASLRAAGERPACPTRRAARRSAGGSSRCRPRSARGGRRTSRRAAAPSASCSVAPHSIVTWNVLPSPGTPSLSTQIVPPISSASRRLIASPSPVPPYRRLVDASTWLNDWNSRSMRSGGMPIPVSRTVRCSTRATSGGRPLAADRQRRPRRPP